MDTIAFYLLKSIIVSAILTGCYWLLLRNKKFHTYNRFFLLFTLIISLVFPLCNFNYYSITQPGNNLVNDFLSSISAGGAGKPAFRFTWEFLLLLGLLSISAFLLLMLSARVLRIYHIKRTHNNTRMEGFNLIETRLKEAPFCFLNNLFWRSDISPKGENGSKIYMHELTHIREKHTYDKLFSQIIVCIFWMNPFYRVLQKELNMIHEFIADARSIGEGDTESFALMLLQSHNEGKYIDPAHSFFHSPVKRRLAMIANAQKPPYSWLRKIAVTPVLLLVVMMFSFTVNRGQATTGMDELMNQQSRDEKIEAEREYSGVEKYERQHLLNNNNISQAALHPAPFLNLKFK